MLFTHFNRRYAPQFPFVSGPKFTCSGSIRSCESSPSSSSISLMSPSESTAPPTTPTHDITFAHPINHCYHRSFHTIHTNPNAPANGDVLCTPMTRLYTDGSSPCTSTTRLSLVPPLFTYCRAISALQGTREPFTAPWRNMHHGASQPLVHLLLRCCQPFMLMPHGLTLGGDFIR